MRLNENDFRCNFQYGAIWEKLDVVPKKLKEASLKCFKKFELDFCAIDLIEKENNFYIIDVNSNLVTKKVSSLLNINICDLIVENIVRKI